MRSDEDIKRDVEEELKWDPNIDPTDIGISVKNSVVALTGFVRSYVQKWEAELAAKRTQGVVAVANDIEVRLPGIDERPDPDIAREAVTEIRNQMLTTADNIKIIVKGGWVTLEGEVEWNYQRELAESVVRRLRGVKGISDLIKVKPRMPPDAIEHKIEGAFRRNAEVDAMRITIEANGSEVTLKGTVRSWGECQAAERVAWSAPGVTKVINRIVVDPNITGRTPELAETS